LRAETGGPTATVSGAQALQGVFARVRVDERSAAVLLQCLRAAHAPWLVDGQDA